ncbi:MAG: hypothetical protein SCH98_15135 [Deferrisomatales bacterium]|nr:hypothetical protein [Deferrisomatales bacterium]
MNKLKKALLRAEEEGRRTAPSPPLPQGEGRGEGGVEGGVTSRAEVGGRSSVDRGVEVRGEGRIQGRGEGGVEGRVESPGAAASIPEPSAPGVAEKIRAACWDGRVFEQLRGLRSQVLARLERVGGRSLLVTSPDPGAGSSFTALHLALSLSGELRRPTLLVDAAPGPGSLGRVLGWDAARGRGARGGAAPVASGLPGLWLTSWEGPLPGQDEGRVGTAPPDPLAAFDAAHPETLVILDGPALSEGPGARLLGELAHGVLLVVEAERTSRRSVQRALGQLGGLPVLGVLLNKWRGPLR